MSAIEADRTLCQGYVNCMVAAPDHFDLDDDDKVIILNPEPGTEDLGTVTEAVNSCPARALKLAGKP